mmetsp:Transcript_106364/g.280605  ORF Transcript_106364/g.280605 Transcript_106364/m.280605 type:complete len:259 (-) Transcript_106364:31-807(-)
MRERGLQARVRPRLQRHLWPAPMGEGDATTASQRRHWWAQHSQIPHPLGGHLGPQLRTQLPYRDPHHGPCQRTLFLDGWPDAVERHVRRRQGGWRHPPGFGRPCHVQSKQLVRSCYRSGWRHIRWKPGRLVPEVGVADREERGRAGAVEPGDGRGLPGHVHRDCRRPHGRGLLHFPDCLPVGLPGRVPKPDLDLPPARLLRCVDGKLLAVSSRLQWADCWRRCLLRSGGLAALVTAPTIHLALVHCSLLHLSSLRASD